MGTSGFAKLLSLGLTSGLLWFRRNSWTVLIVVIIAISACFALNITSLGRRRGHILRCRQKGMTLAGGGRGKLMKVL